MYSLDYLPFMQVIRFAGPDTQKLLDVIAVRLETAGIRVAVLPGDENNTLLDDKDIAMLASGYDLILVDGPCRSATACLVLGKEPLAADSGDGLQRVSCLDENGIDICTKSIEDWLMSCVRRTPVTGCVLIGGRSSRMGQPKHLICDDSNRTWLERTVDCLQPHVETVVISGAGEIPATVSDLMRVVDLPGGKGPMAGVAAVMQAYPLSSLLVVACDMPDISAESVAWLLAHRKPGRAAIVPYSPISGKSEPLFAWYGRRSIRYFYELIGTGVFGMHRICHYDDVYQPEIPDKISRAWRNVNRPGDLC